MARTLLPENGRLQVTDIELKAWAETRPNSAMAAAILALFAERDEWRRSADLWKEDALTRALNAEAAEGDVRELIAASTAAIPEAEHPKDPTVSNWAWQIRNLGEDRRACYRAREAAEAKLADRERDIDALKDEVTECAMKLAAAESDAKALRETLAFAASVIKSGEPWSDTCEKVIGAALSAGKPG